MLSRGNLISNDKACQISVCTHISATKLIYESGPPSVTFGAVQFVFSKRVARLIK